MFRFVDRQKEMTRLQKEYDADRSSLVILYGRRRVGKTALISEFIKDKDALYFLATEESEAQNRKAFKDVVADYLNNDLLHSAEVGSWDPIFQTLINPKPKDKRVLVIDEFQYLGKSEPAFPSIFQRVWDTLLKDENIMVILCGSLITMMESQTLKYTSPLYGRRTAQIKLSQIPFCYYHEFYPQMDSRDLIEHYAITGGVPKYIELCDSRMDVFDVIDEYILETTGFLYEEPNFLLRNEVSEVGSYFSIIKAIAAGNQKLGKISTVLEVPQTNLSKYLRTLIDLDILEREVPVTEDKPEKSKKGLYKIKDNFIRFWFRFVFPYRSYLERGDTEYALNKIRKNFVDGHVSYVFEDICREKLWELSADGIWNFSFDRVGRWWDNSNNEIDAVAVDENGRNLLLGECKYWTAPVGANVLRNLEAKADLVEWNKGNRTVWLALFSASGFTDDLKEIAYKRSDVQLIEF